MNSVREPLLYRLLRPIIRFLFFIVFRPRYEGLENIPSSGSFVLAGNHTNNLDCILLISSIKRTIHFLAKDELMKGFGKILFGNMGIIAVNRRIHDKGALVSAIQVLNQNKVIGIFPEGTINKTKDIVMPFKIGAVKMSRDTNSPIIPFVIIGKYQFFRRGIRLIYLKPYFVGDDLSKENDKLIKIISNELVKRRNEYEK